MGTKSNEFILEDESDSAVSDKILYIIKDMLPKAVVADLFRIINEIEGVKHVLDMQIFVLIEFYTKSGADAAREKGIEYNLNGEVYNAKFTSVGCLSMYMLQKFKDEGKGY